MNDFCKFQMVIDPLAFPVGQTIGNDCDWDIFWNKAQAKFHDMHASRDGNNEKGVLASILCLILNVFKEFVLENY